MDWQAIVSLKKMERRAAVSSLPLQKLQTLAEGWLSTDPNHPQVTLVKGILKRINLSNLEPLETKNAESALSNALSNLAFAQPEFRNPYQLSLDQTFEREEDRWNAICQDLEKSNIPAYRIPEFLSEHLFDNDPGSATAQTFLCYAAGKLSDQAFSLLLQHSAEIYGAAVLKDLLSTPQGWPVSVTDRTTALQTGSLLDFPRTTPLTPQTIALLKRYLDADDRKDLHQNWVNTHIQSAHKSADDSHTKAFQSMAARHDLGEVNINNESGRSVALFFRSPKLKEWVDDQNKSLQKKIKDMLNLDDTRFFEDYLRHGETQDIAAKTYVDLTPEEKEKLKLKMTDLRTTAKSALRYMDDMLNNHAIPGNYYYKTNTPATCGLTMEEMIAAAYGHLETLLSSDKVNAFLALVYQISDMRRGYNNDQMESSTNPQLAETIDQPRCHEGAMNALAAALVSFFPNIYEVRVVTEVSVRHELKKIYLELIKQHPEILKTMTPTHLSIWKTTGHIMGKARRSLEEIFNQKVRQIFEGQWKGTISNQSFAAILDQGLDFVPFPQDWDEEPLLLEDLAPYEIDKTLVEGNIPLWRLDPKVGYQTTLAYLCGLKNQTDLAQFLWKKPMEAERESNPANLLALARAEIPELADRMVFSFRDQSIRLKDLKGLTENEVRFLDKVDPSQWLTVIIGENRPGLFAVYARSITFNEAEIRQTYGLSNSTPPVYAAMKGQLAALQAMIQHYPEVLIRKDTKGNSLLHHSTLHGNLDICDWLLKQANSEQRQALLNPNTDGDTPMHLAVQQSKTEMIELLLGKAKTEEERKALFARNNQDRTPLHVAVSLNKIESVRLLFHVATPEERKELFDLALLTCRTAIAEFFLNQATKEERARLFDADTHGHNPLHVAVTALDIHSVRFILQKTTEQERKVLFARNKHGETPLRIAVNLNNIEIVRLLFHVANPEERKELFDLAILTGRTAIAEFSLNQATEEERARLFAADTHGHNPLHVAVQISCTESVKCIIEAYESMHWNKPNKDGKTPLAMAEEKGLDYIVQILKTQLAKRKQPSDSIQNDSVNPKKLHLNGSTDEEQENSVQAIEDNAYFDDFFSSSQSTTHDTPISGRVTASFQEFQVNPHAPDGKGKAKIADHTADTAWDKQQQMAADFCHCFPALKPHADKISSAVINYCLENKNTLQTSHDLKKFGLPDLQAYITRAMKHNPSMNMSLALLLADVTLACQSENPQRSSRNNPQESTRRPALSTTLSSYSGPQDDLLKTIALDLPPLSSEDKRDLVRFCSDQGYRPTSMKDFLFFAQTALLTIQNDPDYRQVKSVIETIVMHTMTSNAEISLSPKNSLPTDDATSKAKEKVNEARSSLYFEALLPYVTLTAKEKAYLEKHRDECVRACGTDSPTIEALEAWIADQVNDMLLDENQQDIDWLLSLQEKVQEALSQSQSQPSSKAQNTKASHIIKEPKAGPSHQA